MMANNALFIFLSMGTIFANVIFDLTVIGPLDLPPELIKIYMTLPLLLIGAVAAILLLIFGIKKLNKIE